mmetsp:Transcript_19528/g.34831  ORF Transcript_19528/g.34831 Transcript_19528/m.34831 type:complete len:354 (-) Transcript_19528:173-1234(-)
MSPEELDVLLARAAAVGRARAAVRGDEDSQTTAPESDTPPSKRYRFIRTLGRGGTSRVDLVSRVQREGEELALKRIRVKCVNGQLEPLQVRQVLAELHALEICSHPSIPRLTDAFRDKADGGVCLVMTVARGKDLMATFQERGKPFSQGEVMNWARVLLESLEAIHSQGIVYVDIKPENIVLQEDEEDGRLSLVDFGLCFVTPHRDSSSHASSVSCALMSEEVQRSMLLAGDDGPSFWGTAEYAAPEVIDGGVAAFSRASDFWSLGVLMYELLYGRTPFRGHSAEQTFNNIRMRGVQFPERDTRGREQPVVSMEVQQLIRGLLRQKVEYRLGTASRSELANHPAFRAATRPAE